MVSPVRSNTGGSFTSVTATVTVDVGAGAMAGSLARTVSVKALAALAASAKLLEVLAAAGVGELAPVKRPIAEQTLAGVAGDDGRILNVWPASASVAGTLPMLDGRAAAVGVFRQREAVARGAEYGRAVGGGGGPCPSATSDRSPSMFVVARTCTW